MCPYVFDPTEEERNAQLWELPIVDYAAVAYIRRKINSDSTIYDIFATVVGAWKLHGVMVGFD